MKPVEKLRQRLRDHLEGVAALQHVQLVEYACFIELSGERFIHVTIERVEPVNKTKRFASS